MGIHIAPNIARNITRITKNNKNVLFYMSLTVPSHFMNQAMIKGVVISPWRKSEWQLIKDRVNVK